VTVGGNPSKYVGHIPVGPQHPAFIPAADRVAAADGRRGSERWLRQPSSHGRRVTPGLGRRTKPARASLPSGAADRAVGGSASGSAAQGYISPMPTIYHPNYGY
jgi:hypothetical protein